MAQIRIPFVRAEFGENWVEVEGFGARLRLDWQTLRRETGKIP
ncbi:MAG: hypothetical protein AB1522_08385 [Chloroflexota bacterium]